MRSLLRFTAYLIFGLNGLLVFLWFYAERLSVPGWFQIFGRMHPMVLHLPIGFFVMAIAVMLLKDQFKPKAFSATLQLIFTLTSLTLVLTALAGIVLSREGGYDNETLSGHLNSGVVLSMLTAVIAGTAFHKNLSTLQISSIGLGFIILIITGHLGATLTHGENYLLGSNQDAEENSTSSQDSITLFAKAVQPVLKKKCTSCHNPKKKKGELILTSQDQILKGGEDGPVFNADNPIESELLKRIHLAIDNDDHMPPSGKPQLTQSEIKLLNRWILSGADFKTIWKTIPETDSLAILSNQVLQAYEKPKARTYDFEFVEGGTIESLNSPFRTVAQLSSDVPALKAGFYLPQYFKTEDLKPLETVKNQLVELNLSGMPITNQDISSINKFKNLEHLNLNNTQVTDEGITKLNGLDKLQKLSLAGNRITAKSLSTLKALPALKEVFIWNTSISKQEIEELQKSIPDIIWNTGYQASENEILKLTPPILKNESFLLKNSEAIELKHNLPGTIIRYTLDGNDPDSINSREYSKPIAVSKHATLKVLATKPGWLKSNILEYNFFVQGIKPIKSVLLSSANKDYKAKGAASLDDNVIGDADNFRDGNWLGFRETKLIGEFFIADKTKPRELTLVYNRNIGSYLMPPETFEIWAGESSASLRLIVKLNPMQPTEYLPNKVESLSYQFSKPFAIVKVIASPVSKLPKWHSGKGEKGWLMVSEIIFL